MSVDEYCKSENPILFFVSYVIGAYYEQYLKKLSKTQAPSPQQALSGQGVPRIPGKYAIAERCCRKIQNGPSMVLRLGTLHVGTLTGRSMEIAEMLDRRMIDICCLQETRWKSNGVCHINSDKEKYKLFWNGQKTAKNGVGIFVREPLAQEVLDIKRIN
ncbi:hypothetical protein HELRODRAFT_182616 [Helobdella robusta]|uniref:Endonuclease/exonuclease/phosphatase domain-containing protein n=1 Tax=Helobdella robusta TaxID=6412 RepID=T1FIH5_HELRO|nr:hypothetical protein HELRODRAFT_182616 [Helobdella robusta]ESN90789.1 hypothetical protein HELRODRAFT_182616 [Helobdella robusta]